MINRGDHPQKARARLCFYGDDFTGSLDALLQYVRGGLDAALLLRLPQPQRLAELSQRHEVIGIAGTARSLATADIASEVAPVLAALATIEPEFVQYKVCSTGDSSPEHGNIGRVLELAIKEYGDRPIPILFAQPDFGRYTLASHHFAEEAGTVYRLDHQPTMSSHPITPMKESDLRVHLQKQTPLPIGYVHRFDYADAATLAEQIGRHESGGVLLDALDDGDLSLIGAALARSSHPGTQFVVGSGGISTALAKTLGGAKALTGAGALGGAKALAGAGTLGGASSQLKPAAPENIRTEDFPAHQDSSPVLAVSGSQSPQTARQIAAAKAAGWEIITIDASSRLITAEVYSHVVAALVKNRSVVVHSTGELPAPQLHSFTQQLNHCYRVLIQRAIQQGHTSRIIICGGDTSSHLMRSLPAETLRIIANPVSNVPVCAVGSPEEWLDNTVIVLKGGQVGPDNLFEIVANLDPMAASRPSELLTS